MQYSTVRTINHKVRIFMTSNQQHKLYTFVFVAMLETAYKRVALNR